jgi:hypothetical protein
MGSTRSFGFIDFSTIEEAKEYMKYTHGVMQFEDGYETRIEFARENDPELANAKNMQQPSSDWFCAKVINLADLNKNNSIFSALSTTSIGEALVLNVERVVKNLTLYRKKDTHISGLCLPTLFLSENCL